MTILTPVRISSNTIHKWHVWAGFFCTVPAVTSVFTKKNHNYL